MSIATPLLPQHTHALRRNDRHRPRAKLMAALLAGCAVLMATLPQTAWALKADAAAPRGTFLASDFLDPSVVYEPATPTSGAGNGAATRVSPSGKAEAVARDLAQRFPQEARAKMSGAFLESLKQWPVLAKQLGVPADDLGSSAAAFLAGNWMVMTRREVSDADFLRLTDQIRGSLARHAQFAATPAANKRVMHEQLVMVGVFMAVANEDLKRHPNPQVERNLRDTARLNLEQLLRMPVDGLEISSQGMTNKAR